MSIRWRRYALVAGVVLSGTIVAAEPDSAPRITGVYSDMWLHLGKKTLNGTEIFIVQNNTGYAAVLQCANGAPGTPVVLPLSVNDNKISFEVPNTGDHHCCVGPFSAAISGKTLKGAFTQCNDAVVLTRKNSYWQ